MAGCGLVAWLSVGRLEGQLDERSNGIRAPAPEIVAPAVVPPADQVAPAVEPVDSP
jgi:hypothetical protein